MENIILNTKLFIPEARSKLVDRARLIKRLNAGVHRKFSLISAPAGFGKTTLVTEWLNRMESDSNEEVRDEFKIAWISLDEDDNDLVRFLTYLITAIYRTVGVSENFRKRAMSMLEAPQLPPTEVILGSLLNEIAVLSEKIILVLDDYHLIEDQPIHDALNFLLENSPPQIHVVISTREDPYLPTARFRAKDQITELRAADLRFTSSEASDFLNQVMGLDLSTEDIAVLEKGTEGWIAGLQLAAISLQGQTDTSRLIQSFSGSHRLVIDYLIEEVLNQQPEYIQTFLLQTSILDSFNSSLCDAITGQNNSQATLERLERTNLFVVPLDNERRWYRYHHLFSDLLRQRAKHKEFDELPDLHRRASEWFDLQGMYPEAIRHALAAKDFEKAGKLIESAGIHVIEQGGNTLVVKWISSLPNEVVYKHPFLCILQAWVMLYAGQIDEAETSLFNAENALEKERTRDEQRNPKLFNGLIHSNRAYLAFLKGQHTKTIKYAEKALAELPENARLFRVQTGIYLGVAYRYQGRLQEALSTYNEIAPIAQLLQGRIAVQSIQNLGDLLWQLTELNQAQEILEKALRITVQHVGNAEMPYCGFIFVLLGRILHQRNKLPEAQQKIEKGVSLCKEWNLPEITALSYLDLANIYWALGKAAKAREASREAIQIFSGFSPWGRKYAEAYLAKIDIGLGNIAGAENWAKSNDLDIEGEYQFHREIEYFSLIRLLIKQKEFAKAHGLAERIYQISQETGNKRAELECLVLLSQNLFSQGDVELAIEYLVSAITIAEPQGFIRIFVDEGPLMSKLLYEALARGISTDYVQSLLAAFPTEKPAESQDSLIQTKNGEWIEPLTDREVEVLELIAEGLSRQDIASRLYISLNTVKAHTRKIYQKLGVRGRLQAVTKAQLLGLLDRK